MQVSSILLRHWTNCVDVFGEGDSDDIFANLKLLQKLQNNLPQLKSRNVQNKRGFKLKKKCVFSFALTLNMAESTKDGGPTMNKAFK